MTVGPLKYQDLRSFIEERNRCITRGAARTKQFNDNKKNYYFYRLNVLDQLNPEFKGLGLIKLKKEDK